MRDERKLEVLAILKELRPEAVEEFLRSNGLSEEMVDKWRDEEEAEESTSNPRDEDETNKRLDLMSKRVDQLEKENKKLQDRLKQAKVILEFHKNLSELMGIPLKDIKNTASD